jgi:hypothetical protein
MLTSGRKKPPATARKLPVLPLPRDQDVARFLTGLAIFLPGFSRPSKTCRVAACGDLVCEGGARRVAEDRQWKP